MHVLVTGGCGYIGSHTAVELIGAGHRVTVVDDLSNSSAAALDAVHAVTGEGVELVRLDLRDIDRLDAVFASASFDAVIHFAGLKAVPESVAEPLRYYDVNVGGAVSLCQVMDRHEVRKLVFSSSASVYGAPDSVPIPETAPLRPTNAYARTKTVIEGLLTDLAASAGGWRITSLRYFNPIGAHPSALLGEEPRGVPNNLAPYIAQVAVGRRPELLVTGDDWDTPDGTGVRDYIHVMDLAAGHLAALASLPERDCVETLNLGTGAGTSVYELLAAFEAAVGAAIPHRVVARRPGDVAVSYADPSRAHQELGWKAERSLAEACADAWRWQHTHPDGFVS